MQTPKKRRPRKKEYAPVRHAFLYTVQLPDGSVEHKKAKAKVIKSRYYVDLVLDEQHIRESMKLKGVGNTATCSMAICTYRHADKFPHTVVGITDWTYGRAFVGSKLDVHGLPCECWAYEHDDEIARLNDSLHGQRKLLTMIKKNGPITIRLKPYRQRSVEGRPGRNRKGTGARDPMLRTHKLRYLTSFKLGVLPKQVISRGAMGRAIDAGLEVA